MSANQNPIPLSELIQQGHTIQDMQGNSLHGEISEQQFNQRNIVKAVLYNKTAAFLAATAILGLGLRFSAPSSEVEAAPIKPDVISNPTATASVTVPAERWTPEATDCDEPVLRGKTLGPAITLMKWNDFTTTSQANDFSGYLEGPFHIDACMLDMENGVKWSEDLSNKSGKTVYEIDLTKLFIRPNIEHEDMVTAVSHPTVPDIKQRLRDANPVWNENQVIYEAQRILTVVDGAKQAVANNMAIVLKERLQSAHQEQTLDAAKDDLTNDLTEQMIADGYDPSQAIFMVVRPPDGFVVSFGGRPPDPADLAGPFTFLKDQTALRIKLEPTETTEN